MSALVIWLNLFLQKLEKKYPIIFKWSKPGWITNQIKEAMAVCVCVLLPQSLSWERRASRFNNTLYQAVRSRPNDRPEDNNLCQVCSASFLTPCSVVILQQSEPLEARQRRSGALTAKIYAPAENPFAGFTKCAEIFHRTTAAAVVTYQANQQ